VYRQCEEAMAVLQNDNEQLEQEKSALKERLKQLTKNKLVDDLMQKKIGGNQRTSGLLSKHIFIFLSPIDFILIQVPQSMVEFLRNGNYHHQMMELSSQRQMNKKY
jgi:Tfp pilus assembly protein PilO